MTSPSSVPLSADVSGAMARFFHGGAGPSHTVISRILTETGYSDDYQYQGGIQGPNKESRVLKAFAAARREPARARQFIDGLLGALRLDGLVGSASANTEDVDRLRRALGGVGWYLNEDGYLRAFAGVDFDTGGRQALDELVARLRRSTSDPALMIGTAKDLLESVAKFVLEEMGYPIVGKTDFNQLWYLARERLGVLPQQVDPDLPQPTVEAIRAIHQSTWQIAEQANRLRNLQGVGHGRTLPTGVSEELALLVTREACTVAEYMLGLLDRSVGKAT